MTYDKVCEFHKVIIEITQTGSRAAVFPENVLF
jgi:hypothetical protein